MPTAARVRRDVLALLAYLVLALFLTYPLVLHFTTHVPGDGADDPALAWNLWWVRYALFDLGRSPIYTDYLFFPIGLNLAFYTLTYLNAFISIPLQFALGIITAANVNLLLSFTFSGFGAYLLIKYLVRDEFAAFGAGLLYAFSSDKFLYASLGQFNIASSQWIPFYILFLLKLFPGESGAERPRHPVRYGFLLGLFLLLEAWSEFIFASFLVLFTIAYLVYWLIKQWRTLRREPPVNNAKKLGGRHFGSSILGLVVAAITFLVPMAPILAAMASDTLAEGDFIQSGLGFSNAFSADLFGFFIPSHLHPLFGGLEAQFHFAYTNFVYLGYVALALAVIAVLRVPRARIWAVWFVLILLIALGPTLRVNGGEINLPLMPFNALLQLPLIKGNRYPSRWSVLLTLTLAVMVGYALAELGKTMRRSPRTWYAAGSTALLVLLLFEHVSVPLPLSDLRVPAIYGTVAQESGDFSVMELPLAWRNGFRVTGSYQAGPQTPIDRGFMLAQWYQTAHRHPILNGNTSRNPELKFQYFAETPVLDSIIALQTGHILDAATRARDRELGPRLLQYLGTRYVIWHTPHEQSNQDVAQKTRAYVEEIFPLTKISESYENGQGVTVYRVDNLATPNDTGALSLGSDRLERFFFGEGWGALEKGLPLLAQRKEVKVFLPVSELRDRQISLQKLVVPSDQSLAVEVNGKTVVADTVMPSEYRFTIPARALHMGVNEVTLQFQRLVQVSQMPKDPVPIGRTGAMSPVWITARSAGEEQGDFGHIYVNGVDESPNGRGYNIVVIDPQSGRVEERANFDTCGCDPGNADPEAKSHALAAFIARIAAGKIVVAAVRDEASLHLTPDAAESLKSIGASQDLSAKFRWSHAVIGVKGARAGSAVEASSEIDVSQVVVGGAATEPDLAASIGEINVTVQP